MVATAKHAPAAALLLCALLLAAAPAHAKPPLEQVAFQGSALLAFYYTGIVESLLGCGAIVPGRTNIAGLSGGAYTAVWTTIGLSGQEQFDYWESVIRKCATQFQNTLPGECGSATDVCKMKLTGCEGRGFSVVKEILARRLTDDNVKKVNGRVRMAISQLNSKELSLNSSASWIVKSWRNRFDLAAALTSTGYLPCFSGPDTYTTFRNEPVIDGAFSSGFEDLCPKRAKECIKIGTYVIGPLANKTCDPGKCPNGPCSDGTPRTDRVKKLYKFTSDFKMESIRMKCPATAWSGSAPYPLPDYVPQDSVQPDIHPGKFNPLPSPAYNGGEPLLECQWKSLALELPLGSEPEAMTMEFNTGKADGASWCAANGYAA